MRYRNGTRRHYGGDLDMGQLPDVCLAPYEAGELAPDEPLCAPASYRVWAWGWYLVRPVELYDEDTETLAVRASSPCSPVLRVATWGIASRIPQSLRRGDYNRKIYFDENLCLISSREWRFSLWIDKGGEMAWEAHDNLGAVSFRWDAPKRRLRWRRVDLRKYSAEQVEREVRAHLADESSDCAFAWRWLQMDEQERIELSFLVQDGERRECEDLLRAILWSESSLDQSVERKWSICAPVLSEVHQWRAREAEIEQGKQRLEPSPRQGRLLEMVIRHFGLHLNIDISRYTIIYDWRSYGDGEFFIVSAPVSTAHERLEARLWLREWLADKVATEEIPALLGDA